MLRLTPTFRVSLGLVLITISILMLGQFLGLAPDDRAGLLDGRKKFAESIAVQFTAAVSKGDIRLLDDTLSVLVSRNDDLLSAALRQANGQMLAEAGEHASNWTPLPLHQSTIEQVQVPIYAGHQVWGSVELRFTELHGGHWFDELRQSFMGLILFSAIIGLFAYWLFVRKAVRELNPQTVIPERVKSAFDALAEGVFILDDKERIMLVNNAILNRIGEPLDFLLGKKASALPWEWPKDGPKRRKDGDKLQHDGEFPWQQTLRTGEANTSTSLPLKHRRKELHSLMVNCSPIQDEDGAIRGVLTTFDDMTALERKHSDLQRTLRQLQVSKQELSEKNRELEILATRDPLTNCLNRRAFFDRFDVLFHKAAAEHWDLSCIMLDLDHFKNINDTYGHSTGDKVVKMVADFLHKHARPEDVVGRYGGEEFCILLPGVDAEDAAKVADRIRQGLHEDAGVKLTSSVRVTASFGVSSNAHGAANPSELVKQADKALYVAKESGRNRVIRWNQETESVANTPAEDTQSSKLKSEENLVDLKRRIATLERALARRDEEMHALVSSDQTTGLPNRLLFYDRIEQVISRGRRYDNLAAILSVELDMSKRVKNTLGHTVGDELLKVVAARMSKSVRPTDSVALVEEAPQLGKPTVSRIDSDEFGILLTDLRSPQDVVWIIKRIFDTLSERIEIGGHEIYPTVNIGISMYPHDGDNARMLLRNANAARQHAREQMGRNNFHFYSSEINEDSSRQMRIESQLHKALQQGEFLLHYQPKLDPHTGRITSMEALIRWHNEELGMVMPNDFIPIAEHTGLICKIGEWVLRSACYQIRSWLAQGYDGITVAINLSAVELRNPSLTEEILKVLAEIGVGREHIELELTESVLVDSINDSAETLIKLHQAGFKLSIDDFGTGYSSLSYLKRFPVDKLKIDRSFLTDVPGNAQDEALISAIVAMAHSLNLSIVAEGVEHEAQIGFLRESGCDEIQGYHFSRPVPAEQATELLSKNSQGISERLRESSNADQYLPSSAAQADNS